MYQNFIRKTVILVSAVVLLWLTIRYVLPVALPFGLGAVLALAAEPTVNLLQQRLRFPRTAAVAVAVTGVWLLLGAVAGLLLAALLRQLTHLGGVLPELAQAVAQGSALLRDRLLAWLQHLPGNLAQTLTPSVENLLSGGSALLEQLAAWLPGLATGVVAAASEGIFGVLVGLISGYMLSGRLPQLRQWLAQKVPNQIHERVFPALRALRKALGGWLLAQLKLAGIAAVGLCLGFWVLHIDRPVLWAALITVVDVFPVLGVGAVLLPWSGVCLLQGEVARGVGLLVVYSVIWLVRSVLEPKLVGKELDMDPLVTLVAIYAGFRLLGLAGLLLAPVAAVVVTQTLKTIK